MAKNNRNQGTNFLGQVVAFDSTLHSIPSTLGQCFCCISKQIRITKHNSISTYTCVFHFWGSHQKTRWTSTCSKEKMCIKYGNTAAKERSGCSIMNRTLLHIASMVKHATRVARMFPAITNLWTQLPNGSFIVLWCKLRAINEKELHGRAQ